MIMRWISDVPSKIVKLVELRQVQRRTASSIDHWPRALHLIVLAIWGVAASRPAVRFISRDRRERSL